MNDNIKKIDGSVTAAKGFLAGSAAAGFKYQGRDDIALVFSKVKAVTAGVFTRNVVKAAPVVWDQMLVKEEETAQAMVLNSGIANACTGEEGMQINSYFAQSIADGLSKAFPEAKGLRDRDVLTASTGVIGYQIKKDAILRGADLIVPALSEDLEGGHKAARAIMTTDTIPKECAVSVEIGGATVTIGGMSKGSGMIHPDMATMLCVITTDAAITKELLVKAVRADVKDSFNMISVDRDTSTNDTMVAMANGLAGNPVIDKEDESFQLFCEALAVVTQTLAKTMAGDGEGATKLLETTVLHADTKEHAAVLAKSVIDSPLVKTAMYGNDANWGRILCALGYAGVDFDPQKVDLEIKSENGSLSIVKDSVSTGYSEEIATKILSGKEVTIVADLHNGDAQATAWGCDLTYDYVKINGDYRS